MLCVQTYTVPSKPGFILVSNNKSTCIAEGYGFPNKFHLSLTRLVVPAIGTVTIPLLGFPSKLPVCVSFTDGFVEKPCGALIMYPTPFCISSVFSMFVQSW
ncbi:hypothetical protein D3C80_1665780 [compost metagenome]